MTDLRAQTKSMPAWKSPWVIGWIVLVSVVLVVNLTLVILGVSTNPDVNFPLVGAWDTLVAVRHGGEEFTHGRRVQVPGPAVRTALPAVN